MDGTNYIDIHCHSVMTHYRNREKKVPACDEFLTPINEFVDKLFGRESFRSYNTQADFGKLIRGGAGAIIISLYPIERKWFLPGKLTSVIQQSKSELMASITGFSEEYVLSETKRLHNHEDIHYYDDLVSEYEYLKEQVGNPCNGIDFKICTNYTEFEENKNSNSFSVIISIEGGHALGTISFSDLDKKTQFVQGEDYFSKYRENVYKMKSWGPSGSHTPLFITLAHHYWNMLVGHCESLPFFFDQKEGKETGFTDAGREMIADLLSDEDTNGVPNKTRRVLIDVKHMSPLARKQYYRYVSQLKAKTGLHIPVICSHASIGDAPSLNAFIKGTDDYNTFVPINNYFNTSSLSLNNEDIKTIIDSDGLIGIILHEGRIATKEAMNRKPYRIRYLKRRIRYARNDINKFEMQLNTDISFKRKKRFRMQIADKKNVIEDSIKKMREAYINMFMANIFKVIDVYSEHNPTNPALGWEHICIGSDFDGTINELDYLGSAEHFPILNEEITRFLVDPRPLLNFNTKWSTPRLKELQFGIPAKTLADKFMNGNTEAFLKKYFNEEYLVKGVVST